MTDQKTDKEDVSVAGSEGVDAQQPEPPSTLLSQLNWRRLNEGEQLHSISEYPLYSDSRFTDEYVNSPGPYSILNPVPLSQVGTVACSMVLRVGRYWKQGDVQYMAPEKDVSRYHGGTLKDEIAALISLALGTRVLAGEESRRFEIQDDGDEYGRPIAWNETPVPIIQARTHSLVLPSVRSRPRLDALALLETIPAIPETRFPELIRACRFYQDALWLAEAEPNLSWLMLVSALEIVASDATSALEDAVKTLESAKSELCKELAKCGGAELVEYVAKEFEGTFKITNRFIKRTLELLPDPPASRPKEKWLQVPWSKGKMREVLNKIYDYRSRALHCGIPFPPPMLDPPFSLGDAPFSEIPSLGLRTASKGGTWEQKDLPITLDCFHYIARGVLLKWWKNLAGAP